MKVTLAHVKNPDIDGGYWSTPVEGGRKQTVKVANLAEASKVCRSYIERNNLGGGNWTGGRVTSDKGEFVAKISFNGRAWDTDGYSPNQTEVHFA